MPFLETESRAMEITAQELHLLNFYRASELHGGLILGHLVERARDQRLALELTRHSAEEVAHAQLWAETIVAVGGKVRPVRTTYQRRYAALLGHPSSLLQVLIATQVFERRVYRHFLAHLRRPGTHPRVRETLHRMIEEEKHHLSWVKEWLDEQRETRGEAVDTLMDRYADADRELYDRLLVEHGWMEAAA
jgi:demethoxyubiquinone hydroxylase (CLK1/Coq7/Cat5 family)